MKEIRIAFYKAPFRSITDFIISTYTFIFNLFTKPYSHVEIGFYIDGKWVYFSSSIRDGGTRWIEEKHLLKNINRWDIYFENYEDEKVERMIKRANSILGAKYDKLGILGFITPTGRILNKKSNWYCSEAVFYVLTAFWKKRISPRRLASKLEDFELINLKGERK